jgi:hypothetical protein
VTSVADVTAGQLAGALEGLVVTIDDRGGVTSSTPGVYSGRLAYPKTVARALLEGITGQPEADAGEGRPLDRADGELSAIAAAVGGLERLDDMAQRRVLRYLAERYGIED